MRKREKEKLEKIEEEESWLRLEIDAHLKNFKRCRSDCWCRYAWELLEATEKKYGILP